MQTPGYGAPSAPKSPPWGWIVGCCGTGCAVAAILAVIVAMNIATLAKDAAKIATKNMTRPTQFGVPAPKEYGGAWSGSDGSHLTIRSDGESAYSDDAIKVTGASARLEPDLKMLHIKLMGFGRDFHVDSPPHKQNGATVMSLNGVAFRRAEGFKSEPSR